MWLCRRASILPVGLFYPTAWLPEEGSERAGPCIMRSHYEGRFRSVRFRVDVSHNRTMMLERRCPQATNFREFVCEIPWHRECNAQWPEIMIH
jgi:hypothetical protein